MASSFPIDEKGIFNIFTDYEFVKPHKGAVVFMDCERILVQYEHNTGKLSPGFIVTLRTEPGETYILDTRGFLHEGKRAFLYGEARGGTGIHGSNLPNSANPSNAINTNIQNVPETVIEARPYRPPTILDMGSDFDDPIKNTANTIKPVGSSLGVIGAPAASAAPAATVAVATGAAGATGATGCYDPCRVIPRDYFFKRCEETCFKIPFTAKTRCTDVGILFFCNTVDYCLSLNQFLIYRSAGEGCDRPRYGNCCNATCNSCNTPGNNDFKDTCNQCGPCNSNILNCCGPTSNLNPCSPCSPYNNCNTMRFADCCKEEVCIRTGPTGARGPTGATGAPGRAGTRTFVLDIGKQGFAGKTLSSLNCAIQGAFFLETSVSNLAIAEAISTGRVIFSNCVKLWQCNGTSFQWITPSQSEFVYYDTDGLYLWIVQNQTATLLLAQLGDLVINSVTGDVLVGNSIGQWIFDGANILGPTGATGATGPPGLGIQGIPGPTGPPGTPLGAANFVEQIQPTDFVLTTNGQGSLINFVDIALNGSTSLPTGFATISTLTGSNRRLEIEMSISNVLFASSAVQGASSVGPGQHISGVLSIDLSTFLLNNGLQSAFVGLPVILCQVQQDDTAINVGFPNNVFASLANNQNLVRLVIVYYNAGPDAIDLFNFQTLINLSIRICGIVATS